MLIAIATVGVLLAYANGANDNFKGVATLFGSSTSGYRGALAWATVTTALGSMAALIVARGLLTAFSGNGLVPPAVIADPVFPAAVALAAGLTVLLATRFGYPISTTHALIGALMGAGLVASPSGVDRVQLVQAFLLPLLISPLLAVALAGSVYPALHALRRGLGITNKRGIVL